MITASYSAASEVASKSCFSLQTAGSGDDEIPVVDQVLQGMARFEKNALAVVQISPQQRKQVRIILEQVRGHGSRGSQLTDSFTKRGSQGADARARIQQMALAWDRGEEAGHEPSHLGRREDLPSPLAVLGGDAVFVAVLKF